MNQERIEKLWHIFFGTLVFSSVIRFLVVGLMTIGLAVIIDGAVTIGTVKISAIFGLVFGVLAGLPLLGAEKEVLMLKIASSSDNPNEWLKGNLSDYNKEQLRTRLNEIQDSK